MKASYSIIVLALAYSCRAFLPNLSIKNIYINVLLNSSYISASRTRSPLKTFAKSKNANGAPLNPSNLIGSKEKAGRAVGIDLGTTNSVISVIENGRPVVIRVNGSRITPSVVSYAPDGSILIGDYALKQSVKYPLSTYSSVKRVIGRSFKKIQKSYSKESLNALKVNLNQNFKSKQHLDTENVMLVAPQFQIENLSEKNIRKMQGYSHLSDQRNFFYPENVTSHIIKFLVDAGSKYLNETVSKAVITVPAYFQPLQCEATERAAKSAGLEKVKLLREPEAAALAYGLREKQQQIIIVFDLGNLDRSLILFMSTRNDCSLAFELNICNESYFALYFRRRNIRCVSPRSWRRVRGGDCDKWGSKFRW